MFANIGVLPLNANPTSTVFTSSCYPRSFLHTQMNYLIEPEKKLPLVHDVDVAVAGGGAAGFAAAVAAARGGARVVLIEKFGTLGGCMSTGGWNAGALYLAAFDPEKFPVEKSQGYLRSQEEVPWDYVRTRGIAGEWMARLIDLDQVFGPNRNLADRAMRVGSLCADMVAEAGVELMLDTYVAGPILKDEYIACGLYVENVSGRQAVRARIVIDATANAAVAERTGAPLMGCNWQPSMNITFGIGDVDGHKFAEFVASRPQVPPEFNQWIDEVLIPDVGYASSRLGAHINRLRPVADLVRRAWEEDGYQAVGWIGDVARIAAVFPWNSKGPFNNMQWERADIDGKLDTLDAEHITMLERDARSYMIETVKFYRRYLPGFENAYLLYLSPYIGTRGGRAIESEYVVTEEDFAQARRFDDVIYQWRDERYPTREFVDIPYRLLLPRRVENLLAAGVAAHRKPPNIRGRESVMMMGQAAGTAAALCARQNLYPRQLDVRQLQQALVDAGINLGPKERVDTLLNSKGEQ